MSPALEQFRARILNFVLLSTGGINVVMGLAGQWRYPDLPEVWIIGLLSGGLLVTLYALRRARHDRSTRYAHIYIAIELSVLTCLVWLGRAQVHLEIWSVVFPLTYFSIVGLRERLGWSVAGLVFMGTAMFLRPDPLSLETSVNLISVYGVMCFANWIFTRFNDKNIVRLESMTSQDALTGVNNRRRLDEVLPEELKRCQRHALSLAVFMIDLDHFKSINDNYGHVHGDKVLQRTAQALRDNARRAGDGVFRYGGEEFVALSVGVTQADAATIADKFRTSISDLAIPNKGAPLGVLTASVGYRWVESVEGHHAPDSLLTQADQALYAAKKGGRNRCVAAAPTTASDAEPTTRAAV